MSFALSLTALPDTAALIRFVIEFHLDLDNPKGRVCEPCGDVSGSVFEGRILPWMLGPILFCKSGVTSDMGMLTSGVVFRMPFPENWLVSIGSAWLRRSPLLCATPKLL